MGWHVCTARTTALAFVELHSERNGAVRRGQPLSVRGARLGLREDSPVDVSASDGQRLGHGRDGVVRWEGVGKSGRIGNIAQKWLRS